MATTLTISDKVAAIAEARAAEEWFTSLKQFLEALLLDDTHYASGGPEYLERTCTY